MPEFTQDWTSHNYRHWDRLFAELKGKPNIQGLEIGSYEGRSALWFLENVLTHPTSSLRCLDVWRDPAVMQRFLENTAAYRDLNPPKLLHVHDDSRRAQTLFPYIRFDFVYIDGAHEGMNVLEDAVLTWRLLKVGGIMLFDDYEWRNPENYKVHTPKPAVDAVIQMYPVSVLYKGYQVAVRKLKEDHHDDG